MSVPIEELIPHRPPLRWVEEVLTCTDPTARARVRFTPDHFAVAAGVPIETALVECMAQTVAAALGMRLRTAGPGAPANQGLLAAVSNFKILLPPPLHADLIVSVVEVKRLGPMLMIRGTVEHGSQIIATGDLSLYA